MTRKMYRVNLPKVREMIEENAAWVADKGDDLTKDVKEMIQTQMVMMVILVDACEGWESLYAEAEWLCEQDGVVFQEEALH